MNRTPRSLVRPITLLTSATALALPSLAFAQSNVFATGAEGFIAEFLLFALPFAILAVMVLGVIAATGRLSWAWPIGVVLGIAILFGAPQIVDWVRAIFAV